MQARPRGRTDVRASGYKDPVDGLCVLEEPNERCPGEAPNVTNRRMQNPKSVLNTSSAELKRRLAKFGSIGPRESSSSPPPSEGDPMASQSSKGNDAPSKPDAMTKGTMAPRVTEPGDAGTKMRSEAESGEESAARRNSKSVGGLLNGMSREMFSESQVGDTQIAPIYIGEATDKPEEDDPTRLKGRARQKAASESKKVEEADAGTEEDDPTKENESEKDEVECAEAVVLEDGNTGEQSGAGDGGNNQTDDDGNGYVKVSAQCYMQMQTDVNDSKHQIKYLTEQVTEFKYMHKLALEHAEKCHAEVVALLHENHSAAERIKQTEQQGAKMKHMAGIMHKQLTDARDKLGDKYKDSGDPTTPQITNLGYMQVLAFNDQLYWSNQTHWNGPILPHELPPQDLKDPSPANVPIFLRELGANMALHLLADEGMEGAQKVLKSYKKADLTKMTSKAPKSDGGVGVQGNAPPAKPDVEKPGDDDAKPKTGAEGAPNEGAKDSKAAAEASPMQDEVVQEAAVVTAAEVAEPEGQPTDRQEGDDFEDADAEMAGLDGVEEESSKKVDEPENQGNGGKQDGGSEPEDKQTETAKETDAPSEVRSAEAGDEDETKPSPENSEVVDKEQEKPAAKPVAPARVTDVTKPTEDDAKLAARGLSQATTRASTQLSVAVAQSVGEGTMGKHEVDEFAETLEPDMHVSDDDVEMEVVDTWIEQAEAEDDAGSRHSEAPDRHPDWRPPRDEHPTEDDLNARDPTRPDSEAEDEVPVQRTSNTQAPEWAGQDAHEEDAVTGETQCPFEFDTSDGIDWERAYANLRLVFYQHSMASFSSDKDAMTAIYKSRIGALPLLKDRPANFRSKKPKENDRKGDEDPEPKEAGHQVPTDAKPKQSGEQRTTGMKRNVTTRGDGFVKSPEQKKTQKSAKSVEMPPLPPELAEQPAAKPGSDLEKQLAERRFSAGPRIGPTKTVAETGQPFAKKPAVASSPTDASAKTLPATAQTTPEKGPAVNVETSRAPSPVSQTQMRKMEKKAWEKDTETRKILDDMKELRLGKNDPSPPSSATASVYWNHVIKLRKHPVKSPGWKWEGQPCTLGGLLHVVTREAEDWLFLAAPTNEGGLVSTMLQTRDGSKTMEVPIIWKAKRSRVKVCSPADDKRRHLTSEKNMRRAIWWLCTRRYLDHSVLELYGISENDLTKNSGIPMSSGEQDDADRNGRRTSRNQVKDRRTQPATSAAKPEAPKRTWAGERAVQHADAMANDPSIAGDLENFDDAGALRPSAPGTTSERPLQYWLVGAVRVTMMMCAEGLC